MTSDLSSLVCGSYMHAGACSLLRYDGGNRINTNLGALGYSDGVVAVQVDVDYFTRKQVLGCTPPSSPDNQGDVVPFARPPPMCVLPPMFNHSTLYLSAERSTLCAFFPLSMGEESTHMCCLWVYLCMRCVIPVLVNVGCWCACLVQRTRTCLFLCGTICMYDYVILWYFWALFFVQ